MVCARLAAASYAATCRHVGSGGIRIMRVRFSPMLFSKNRGLKTVHGMPTNVEAIRLYRDVLRTANAFTWMHESGRPWSEVLKENAREEFEQARHETDPLIIARLIAVGNDCVHQAQEKLQTAHGEMVQKIDASRN